MSTKFFNNTPSNTLFEKLKGISDGMNGFYRFLAVVGYFRSHTVFNAEIRKERFDNKLYEIAESQMLVVDEFTKK